MLFAEFEKVKGVLILDSQLCLSAQLGRKSLVEVGLAEQGLLVALILDLMDKDVLGLPKLFRHAEVKLTLQRFFAALEDHEVLGPSDCCNQWLQFWLVVIGGKELAHVEEIAPRESDHTGKLHL